MMDLDDDENNPRRSQLYANSKWADKLAKMSFNELSMQFDRPDVTRSGYLDENGLRLMAVSRRQG
jgi:hypothetical protein